MQIRQANKAMSRLRIALDGTAGSGKTTGALLIALGIAKGDPTKIVLIDTENESADLYAEKFRNKQGDTFNVLSLHAPFSPQRYIEAITLCEQSGAEVIVIDSITQEWAGKGGCLEIHGVETEKDPKKNSYTAWSIVTPMHNNFIQKILSSPCHIVATVRSKTEHELVADGKGGTKVVKLGLGAQTRDGFDFEVSTYFSVGQDHLAEATKDRTGLFEDRGAFKITEETGKEFLSWAYNGVDVSELQDRIRNAESVDEIAKVFQEYPSLRGDNSFVQIAKKKISELNVEEKENV